MAAPGPRSVLNPALPNRTSVTGAKANGSKSELPRPPRRAGPLRSAPRRCSARCDPAACQVNFVHGANVQVRVEAFNVMNRPQFGNPGANRSSLQLNPDGSIRNLNGYTEITGTSGSKSERQVRLGLRIGF